MGKQFILIKSTICFSGSLQKLSKTSTPTLFTKIDTSNSFICFTQLLPLRAVHASNLHRLSFWNLLAKFLLEPQGTFRWFIFWLLGVFIKFERKEWCWILLWQRTMQMIYRFLSWKVVTFRRPCNKSPRVSSVSVFEIFLFPEHLLIKSDKEPDKFFEDNNETNQLDSSPSLWGPWCDAAF